MRLQALPIFKICLIISAIYMAGCAAQSSYKQFYDAQALVERAKNLNPADVRLVRAESTLESGRINLKEARYSRASRDFNESIRIAEDIIRQFDPELAGKIFNESPRMMEPPAPPPPAPMKENITPTASTPPPTAPKFEDVELNKRSPDKMKLPAEALAKYLASKRSAAPVAQKTPAEIERREKEKTIIEASSKIVAKLPPKPSAPPQKKPAVEELKEPAEKTEPPPIKEETKPTPAESQAPGTKKLFDKVEFDMDKSNITTTTAEVLDRMSAYLLENPSTSLIIASLTGNSEGAAVTEARYESVRSYLSGKGVPDDQVRLDPVKKTATKPQFELYLFEH